MSVMDGWYWMDGVCSDLKMMMNGCCFCFVCRVVVTEFENDGLRRWIRTLDGYKSM